MRFDTYGLSAEGQLQRLIDLLTSPAGFLLIPAFVLALILAFTSKGVRWWILAILLYTSTLTSSAQPWFDNTLAFPLQQIRSQGRGITVSLLLTLVLPAVISERGWRSRILLGSVIAFFLLQLVYSVRIAAAGLTARAGLGVLIYIATFIVFGFGISRWFQQLGDVWAMLRAVVITGALFVAGTIFQLIVNPYAIVWNNRIYGTTGNPQHMAVIISILLPMACYLLTRRGGGVWRVLLPPLIGLLVVLLIWTASRTGLLMTLIGIGLLFRRHIGRMIGVTIVCGAFVLIASQFFIESVENVGRLVSTEDTRSAAWSRLIMQFLGSPMFGVVYDAPGIGENSYLSVAARMGFVGLVPLVAMYVLTAISLFKLSKHSSLLADHRLLVDLVTAGLVSIAAGAIFEGLLLGMVTFPVFCIYIYLAIVCFLLDAVTQRTNMESKPHVVISD